jgi:hypothetical protein
VCHGARRLAPKPVLCSYPPRTVGSAVPRCLGQSLREVLSCSALFRMITVQVQHSCSSVVAQLQHLHHSCRESQPPQCSPACGTGEGSKPSDPFAGPSPEGWATALVACPRRMPARRHTHAESMHPILGCLPCDNSDSRISVGCPLNSKSSVTYVVPVLQDPSTPNRPKTHSPQSLRPSTAPLGKNPPPSQAAEFCRGLGVQESACGHRQAARFAVTKDSSRDPSIVP